MGGFGQKLQKRRCVSTCRCWHGYRGGCLDFLSGRQFCPPSLCQTTTACQLNYTPLIHINGPYDRIFVMVAAGSTCHLHHRHPVAQGHHHLL